MGFYYGSGSPPPEDHSGGFRETLAIIWVVFRVLSVPIGILMGVVVAFVALFYLFSLSPIAGFATLGLLIAALVGFGVWESKHPPELK